MAKRGDRNTKFFHSHMNKRQKQLYIHKVQNKQAMWIENVAKLKEEAVRFFHFQLTGSHGPTCNSLLQYIPKLVSDVVK